MRPADPRLRAQLAPAARPLVGVVAAGVVASLLVVGQAWVVTGLVVALVHGGPVLPWAVGTVALLGARGAVSWFGDLLAARAAAVVGTSLRRRLLAAVLERTAPQRPPTGETAALLTRGVASAEPYLTRYVPALVLAAVLPPLTVVAIATQDVLSAVVVLATLPLVPVFGALVGLATRDRAAEQWRAMESLSGHFLDVVRGLPTLVAHRRARAQSARIREVTDRYRVASLRTLRIAFASSAVLELVATLSVALVAVTVGVRLASGGLDLHTALVVLLLAPEAYWPLRRVGAEFHAAAEGVATFEKADAILGGGTATDGSASPAGSAGPGGPLLVDHLTVLHPGRTAPALDDLEALLPERGVTVVTGPSGCGKSTLLAVLAGLLAPTGGSVTVGGVAVGGAAWQSQVAWLPQRPRFVEGSIADNLRLGDPGADDDRLWEVLRRVALEERVRCLPGALDTTLGEDGATLSAGERARLALARVVLARRPWVLLDEPTAHLDELTERVIADTIVDLGRDAGVVVVAHRPAIVALADRVLALPGPAPSSARATGSAEATGLAEATGVGRARTAASGRRTGADDPPDGRSAAPRGLGLSTALGALASASGVALTATAGWLIVQASTRPAVLTLLVAIVGVRLFGLARPVLRYAERLRSHDAALALLAERRVRVYDALVPLTPARLGRRRGDLLTSVVDDVEAVVDRELRVRLPIRTAVVVSALATAVVAWQRPLAGLVVGLAAAGTTLGSVLVSRAGAARAEVDAVALRARLSTEVVDAVEAADELRMWQAAPTALDRVAATSRLLGRRSRSTTRWAGAARALALATSGVAVATVALVCAPAVVDGTLSAPMAALLVLVPLALADVLLPLADAGSASVRTAAAEARLTRLARTAPAVRDTVSRPAPAGRDVDLDAASGAWTRSGPRTAPVSLRLEAGDRVAVVGPSGCGKSTLAALLLRFLDPASGRVSLGGEDTRSLAQDDVRRVVGLVDDDPHVFATTLVENVRLARPGASDDEVLAALRQARLGSWVETLPDGLDTWLGDGHAQVSGGERARLAIARSCLARQPVLVLDEPAAHLDHATAAELAEELLSGPRTRSVLWITHARIGLDRVDRVVDLGAAGASGATADTRSLPPT